MKRVTALMIVIALTLLSPKPVQAEDSIIIGKAWATAYSIEGTTATGTHTTAGRTIASKPEYYGSVIYIYLDDGDGLIKPQNYLYMGVVEDTGNNNIKAGYVLDIYIPDYKQAVEFGSKRVIYQIIKAEG